MLNCILFYVFLIFFIRYFPGYYGDYRTIQKYNDLENYLTHIGINKNDRIASIYDVSPNITLYLMNRKGITIYYKWSEEYQRSMIQQCDYAIVNHEQVLNSSIIAPVFGPLIGEKDGLMIYKIRK